MPPPTLRPDLAPSGRWFGWQTLIVVGGALAVGHPLTAAGPEAREAGAGIALLGATFGGVAALNLVARLGFGAVGAFVACHAWACNGALDTRRLW